MAHEGKFVIITSLFVACEKKKWWCKILKLIKNDGAKFGLKRLKLITIEKGIQQLEGLESENMAKYSPSSGYLFSWEPGKTKAFLLSVVNQVSRIGIVLIIIFFVGILGSKI